MKFLKYVDFFSIKFNFYICNQSHYKNIFGGIMTTFYIFICIFIFFVFSSDDLNKLNPITTKSEIPEIERQLVNMKNSKIWIPFRMVNYENIQENILSDDRNILGSNYKNSSYWGMSYLYSDDYFLSSEYDSISNNSNNSRVFALNIYMDSGLIHYTRSFKKLFFIISDVCPILRIILYF